MAKLKKAAPKKAAPTKTVATKTAAKPIAKVAAKAPATKATGNLPAPVFNIDEINQLIHAVNHSNVNELKLERGDFKITIRQGAEVVHAAPTVVHTPAAAVAAPMQMPSAPAPVSAAPSAAVDTSSQDNLHTIKSPMIGTFYRSSGPGKPVFVNVGDDIKVGDVLCIVEAMKLFNEIESEVSGKVVKVLVDDNSPVEYDQPLFLVQLNA
jgi:acetyl-CoA carboxylase biotin carboxyl carrier protein